MDLSSLFQGAMGEQIVNSAVSQLGIENQQAKSAIAMAVPFLLSAMKKNASEPQGAEGLLGAIQGKHDGSILDNLGSVLGDGQIDMNDGMKILGHVLGGKQQNVMGAISQESGLSSDKVMGLVSMLAPIIMGLIGKNANSQNAGAGDLSGLIGGLLGGAAPAGNQSELSAFEKILDQDGDGNVMNDVMGMGSKLLGGLFK